MAQKGPASQDAAEERRLASLYSFGILDTPAEEKFDRIVRMAARLFGSPIALISLVDRNRQWFKAAVGIDAKETPRAIAFCSHAVKQRDVFVVPDALADPRFADNPLVTGEPHIRFYAGAPLVSSEGEALGTVCLIDRQPWDDWPSYPKEMLKDYAATVMEWLELERHNQLLMRENERLKSELAARSGRPTQ